MRQFNNIALTYRIPSSLRKPAASMIVLQLQSNPARRPSVDKLLQNEFFTSGMLPAALPLSCLTTAPRTDQLEGVSLHRRPLNEVNSNGTDGNNIFFKCFVTPCTMLMRWKITFNVYRLIDIWHDYICTTDHVAMAVDSPVKRNLMPAEPRAVEPTSHRQNLIALRDQLAALLVNKVRKTADFKSYVVNTWLLCKLIFHFFVFLSNLFVHSWNVVRNVWRTSWATPRPSRWYGWASGWTTATSTALVTSCVTRASASCSTTPPSSSCLLTACE